MRLFPLLLAAATAALGAQVSGRIQFSPERPLEAAQITLTNEETGVRRIAWSNAEGYYSVAGLQPGTYKLIVRREGFQSLARTGIHLETGQLARIDLTMELGRIEQSIVVQGSSAFLETEDTTVGTVVDRDALERTPLQGRGLLTLLEAAPGVVVSPALSGRESGQFSVNGQRADANYITIDGVSINSGIGTQTRQGMGGALPAFTAIGSMHSLVSTEALEEFRLETAGTSVESGRMPGGQLMLTTRSGTNRFHGALFEFFRHSRLNANDWFANSAGKPRALEQFQDFGGALGGPIRRDRTFFFAAVENLRLRQSSILDIVVPDLATRQQAPASMRNWLAALPGGAGSTAGSGLAVVTLDQPTRSHVDTASFRLDHAVSSRLQFFSRYQHAPSYARQDLVGGLLQSAVEMSADSVTVGLDAAVTRSIQSHFRFNYTRTQAGRVDRNRGAAESIDYSLFSPASTPVADTNYIITVNAVSLPLFRQEARNWQRQWEFAANSSFNHGRHLIQFGGDYRRLSPGMSTRPYSVFTMYGDLSAFLEGRGTISYLSRREPVSLSMAQHSLYLQDTVKLSGSLTFSAGLRWEFNPPPTADNGYAVLASVNLTDPLAYHTSADGHALWSTGAGNFAPRAGLAWKPWKNRRLVVRSAAGVHHDLGLHPALTSVTWGTRSQTYMGMPLAGQWSWMQISDVHLPIEGDRPDYAIVSPFKTAYSVEWHTTLEQEVAGGVVAGLSYVGAAARRLLLYERTTWASTIMTNRGSSRFNALQAMLRTRSLRGLQGSLSLSWGHSIDNASNAGSAEFTTLAASPDVSVNRGNSDFDIRRSLLAVFSWQPARLHGWSLNGIGRLRGGFPLSVYALPTATTTMVTRPDVLAGQPLWIADANAPGGRRLNAAAFQASSTAGHGSLGRNAIIGPGMGQLDLALQKEIALSERVFLRLRLEAFNVTNHPNFGNPVGDLSSLTFGRPVNMLNHYLGSGGPDSGLVPALQIGGPRALQIGLRLHF